MSHVFDTLALLVNIVGVQKNLLASQFVFICCCWKKISYWIKYFLAQQ